ncbi:ATP-dependent helicase [Rhizobium sp. Root274]|uniref:ATP-dependent helicase HrpB n=1 Tax=unclassified Rhizobium TaxID=2613769 RepID=UPI000715B000|nr:MULTISPECIES: ATP-dependent helicase HrpB [unclassified Rhizobium]KQW27781.1 ATP-dependent helicase [Rhizobium sp. Root1240]KRD28060.1 ATP-dependent helicase [Rhizobium sp. Root274]
MIRPSLPILPITEQLSAIGAHLEAQNRLVLSAPPGAGKTTLVPLSLLDQPWRGDGRIILLEPRRLAARAAATRMASLLGEDVGATVGYRMRLDNRISAQTRIEVVTEGVFVRMILDDPELTGICAVLFDEFHERSLDADFGLALALDAQSALRPDLKIVVMSATLDVERVTRLTGQSQAVISEGRSFPVEIRHRDRSGDERIEDAMTSAILAALASEDGSILAFLPGQAEIRRVAERLEGKVTADVLVTPLYGNLSQTEQDAAIRPAPASKRKVVLSTSIAETSITIDGVRVVIDSGLQRLPVYEASTGITRLETVRVSRASADQRAGRAGRTEPGIAIRLWHAGQTAALPAFTPPEILATDLSGLALDMAHWGVTDPAQLALIDQPPAAALAEARQLLIQLGALDTGYQLTARGRQMRDFGLPARLAAMVLAAAESGSARQAADLAVLLTEQGLGGSDVDLDERLRQFRRENGERAKSARLLASRLVAGFGHPTEDRAETAGSLLLHAFPDRIAKRRGGRGRFVMANGRGAELPQTERLAGADMLVVADLTGKAAQARILSAAEISRSSIEQAMPDAIKTLDESGFDMASRQVRARRVTRIGAIILDEAPLPKPKGEAAAQALADGVRQLGPSVLPFSKATEQLRQRLGFLYRLHGDPWPDTSDEGLVARLEDWFVPFQSGVGGLQEISSGSLHDGLMALVPPGLQRELERQAPTHYMAPTGQAHPIRYDGPEPVLQIRVQELFGLKIHPSIGGGKLPLLLELTSPAHRPIQTTRDLPGFWAGSWRDVRADMRGRYPKHPWPDDPASAAPTTRAKPRGT